ncbi:MAG TPA: hypothetical protein VFL55_13190 [Acetobacteraceae bacterium]|nr:hypothetical protein [Acetobacteraceae bacterium]
MDELRHEDFAPHVDKLFRFEGWHGALRLTAIESCELPRPFTLLFEGPPADIVPEGLYTAVVDDAFRFQLYIMPIHTATAGRQDYQAVFN